eukprot:TRINITY_DN24417_c0_g1_i1.p1 TRINITY_DN24417_c0_g1~~TRINITY_DN24417_c0_g1_i1.p1  ORF type:complete len:866 (-),score=110.12 TRINITY_DN24417_c0_g1_i1:120-2354(-)
MDDRKQCFPLASGDVSVQVMKLRMATACSTQEELCHVLSTLTSQGPDTLVAHVEDIVSLLKTPADATPEARRVWRWRFHVNNSLRMSDYAISQVHTAAFKALQSLGPLCSKYAVEIASALPEMISKETANNMCDDIVVSGVSRRGYDRSSDASFLGNTSDDRHCPPLLSYLSSVFSAMGVGGIASLVEHFQHVFEPADECHKGLFLLSIGRAMMPFTASHSQYISWFASFLKERPVRLSLYAVQSLIEILKCPELQPEFEQYIPEVFSLLCRSQTVGADNEFPAMPGRVHGGAPWLEILSPAACKLLGKLGDRVVPHARLIVSTFMTHASEATASEEIDRFQRIVIRKAHGAFATFLKETTSTVASFSSLLNSLGYGCYAAIMRHSTEMFLTAGPCQQALMLLCMARPFPTFTKAEAADCAPWIIPFLRNPSWQVRACAIVCIQRLMAGYMGPEPHAHDIATLLGDPVPFVRQLAATAIGCLGRNAVRYKKTLLRLLADSFASVRYSTLVTLGGLMALACPHSHAIAAHLKDIDPKCRMAALRALKCMGKTASPFRDALKSWQQRWYARSGWYDDRLKKPEPITARALLFPDVPLRKLFKGHAPLGHRFGGPKREQDARRQKFTVAMQIAEARCIHFREHGFEDTEEPMSLMLDAIAFREAREYTRQVQRQHDAAYDIRRRKKKDQSAHRRLTRKERSTGTVVTPPRHQRMKDRLSRTCSEMAVDWVVPTMRRRCHVLVHLDPQ